MRKALLGLATLFLTCCSSVAPQAPVAAISRSLELIDAGTLHLRDSELDQAWAAFSLAYDIHPFPQAADGLGCVAFLRGDFSEAEAFFVRAYRMDENYFEAMGNLALLYEHLGFMDEAGDLYEYVVNNSPDDFRARNNFAVFLSERRSSDKAREHLLKAGASSHHPVVVNNLERNMKKGL